MIHSGKVKTQGVKPCNHCPFLKTALPGYLGEASYNPQSFLDAMEEKPMPCHMIVDWEDENINPDQLGFISTCSGSLQFQRNIGKLPRNPEYANLVKVSSRNARVFNSKRTFIDYHTKDNYRNKFEKFLNRLKERLSNKGLPRAVVYKTAYDHFNDDLTPGESATHIENETKKKMQPYSWEEWFDILQDKLRAAGYTGPVEHETANNDYENGRTPEETAKNLLDEWE